MSSQYRCCLIHMLCESISMMAGPKASQVFKRKAKQYFGVGNLDGISEEEQIRKMNAFWKAHLEPIPNTTFIRAWLENRGTINEYVMLFNRNWGKDVIASGVLNS